MKGSVLINGVDIADLGAFILRGGDYDFLPFPDRKEPMQNNWFEYNGLDVDLTEVFFKERILSIHFYLAVHNARDYEYNLSAFYKQITQGYIDLYSREFARTFKLRYLSVTEYNHKGGLYKLGDKRGKLKVSFSMDEPLQLFTDPTILVPHSSKGYPASGVVLNGFDLVQFGIIVNECYNSVLALPAVKAPLTRSFSKRTGLLVPSYSSPMGRQGGTRVFEAKEIIVACTMAAPTREEFYYNYEVLFNHMSQEGEMALNTHFDDMKCYYSKMENFKKHGTFSNGVMVSFTLRLIQLDTGIITFVLGAEDGSALLTEDGEYIEITR